MSQAGPIRGGGGPTPPDVPTQFLTDTGTTAIPAGNQLIVTGEDTQFFSPFGIRTNANPDLSNILQFELTNRAVGTVITADATPTTLVILDFTQITILSTSVTFHGMIVGDDNTNNDGASFVISGGCKNIAGTVSLLGVPTVMGYKDASLSTTDVTFSVATPNSLVFQVTGVAATNIFWRGLINFIVGIAI